jgi:hypothetical protein
MVVGCRYKAQAQLLQHVCVGWRQLEVESFGGGLAVACDCRGGAERDKPRLPNAAGQMLCGTVHRAACLAG